MKSVVFAAVAVACSFVPAASALSQDNPFAANPAENPFATAQVDRYAGVFQSDAVQLTLEKAAIGFTGELYYVATNTTYPLTASHADGNISGVFVAGGANFPFTFTLKDDGSGGLFETEGYSGTLARAGGNSGSTKNIKPVGKAEAVLNEALEIAKTVAPDKKGQALSSIIGMMAAFGDIDGAKALLNTIPGGDIFRNYAINGIASAQLKQGDFNGAMATANTMTNPALRKRFDGEIISYHITNGDAAQGLSLARNTAGASDRVDSLMAAASAFRGLEDEPQARAVTEEAKAVALSISDETARNSAVFTVGFHYVFAGDTSAALELANTLPRDIMKMTLLATIGKANIQAGDQAGARAIAEGMLKDIKKIKSKFARPGAYTQVASIYVGLNDIANLTKVQMKYDGTLTAWYTAVAFARIEFKQFDTVQSLIRSTVLGTNSAIVQQSLDFAIANDQAQRGDFDGALATARSIVDPLTRISALTIIGSTMHGQKQ